MDEQTDQFQKRSNGGFLEIKRKKDREQTRTLRANETVSLAESRKEDDGRVKVGCEVGPKDVSSLEGAIGAVDGVSNRDVGARDDVHDEDVGRCCVLPFITLSIIDRYDSRIRRVGDPSEPVTVLSIKETACFCFCFCLSRRDCHPIVPLVSVLFTLFFFFFF